MREAGRFDQDTADRIADLRHSLAGIRDRLRPAPRPTRMSAVALVTRGYAPAEAANPPYPSSPTAVAPAPPSAIPAARYAP